MVVITEFASAYALGSFLCFGVMGGLCCCYMLSNPIKKQTETQTTSMMGPNEDLILITRELYDKLKDKILLQNQPPPTYKENDIEQN